MFGHRVDVEAEVDGHGEFLNDYRNGLDPTDNGSGTRDQEGYGCGDDAKGTILLTGNGYGGATGAGYGSGRSMIRYVRIEGDGYGRGAAAGDGNDTCEGRS